jgi:phage gp45-like
VRFFTAIIDACRDLAGKLRSVTATAGDEVVRDRNMIQQFGFVSVPKKGDRVLFVQSGNFVIGIASDSANRPEVKEGEAALYRTTTHFIRLNDDGTVLIVAPKGVDIDGDLRVSGDVSDSVGTLSGLRNNYNAHAHIGNLGAPTATPLPQDTGAPNA